MAPTFQYQDVDELLTLMERWGIVEMHLAVDEAMVDLVRAVPAALPAAPAAAPLAVAEPAGAEPVVISAPAVGVFHLAHSGFTHGAPRPGDQIQAGQVIGTIELMRVPNDLVAPVSGTIEAIPVDDGAGVEYGQPLMVIHPFEEVSENEAGMLPPPAR